MARRWFKFNFSYPLTLLGALFFLFLGVRAFSDLWTYDRLSTRVAGVVDQWKVVKKSSAAYPIQASYHFEFQGKTYQEKTLLAPPYHLNRLSAQQAIEQLQKLPWTLWIDPKNPQVSALQKIFPWKKLMYTLVALGITCYFGFLETHSRIRNPIK